MYVLYVYIHAYTYVYIPNYANVCQGMSATPSTCLVKV